MDSSSSIAPSCSKLCHEISLPEETLPEAAALSAAAFEDTPSYKFMYPESEGRVTFLAWLFERNFWLRLGTDAIRCTYNEEGKLVAFFMFVKPDVPHPGTLDILRAGLLWGLWLFGWGTVQRVLTCKDWFEKKGEEILGGRKAIWIERMTVLPSCQGRGVGSRALGEALKEADRLDLPCVLENLTERNLRFYERLGFVVVDYCTVPEKLGGYRCWIMIREPQRVKGVAIDSGSTAKALS